MVGWRHGGGGGSGGGVGGGGGEARSCILKRFAVSPRLFSKATELNSRAFKNIPSVNNVKIQLTFQ